MSCGFCSLVCFIMAREQLAVKTYTLKTGMAIKNKTGIASPWIACQGVRIQLLCVHGDKKAIAG